MASIVQGRIHGTALRLRGPIAAAAAWLFFTVKSLPSTPERMLMRHVGVAKRVATVIVVGSVPRPGMLMGPWALCFLPGHRC